MTKRRQKTEDMREEKKRSNEGKKRQEVRSMVEEELKGQGGR